MFASWTIKKLAPHLVWVQDNCIFAGFVVLFPFLSAELEMTWLPDTKEKLTAKRQWKWILFGKISSMKNSTSYRRILAKIGRHNISLSGIHFWALLPLWEVQLNSKHETTLGSLREARGRPWNHLCLSKRKKLCHKNNERKELQKLAMLYAVLKYLLKMICGLKQVNEEPSVEFAQATSLQGRVLEQPKKSDYFKRDATFVMSNFCFIIIWYIAFPVYEKCNSTTNESA